MKFRLAMGQMLVEDGRPVRNLQRAESMIQEAARRGCRAIVLPECLDLGWTSDTVPCLASSIPGQPSLALCRAAREAGILVAAGLTERDDERIYNAAVLIGPDGSILLKHRKINELDIARNSYSIGDRLGVVSTPLGIVGLNICADNFPDSLDLGRSLARMGAQTILSPCAWAVDASHDNILQPYGDLWIGAYSTLAQSCGVCVAGVSNVGWMTSGPWKGRKCIGCSLAVGPKGILARAPYGETAEALVEVEMEVKQ